MEDKAEVQRSLDHQWKSRRDPVKGAHGISTQAGEQAIGEPTPGRQLEELEGQTTQPDADGSTRIAGQLLTWDPSPQPQGPATLTPIPTHPVLSVEEQGGKRKYETLNYPLTSEETVQMRSPKSGLCAASSMGTHGRHHLLTIPLSPSEPRQGLRRLLNTVLHKTTTNWSGMENEWGTIYKQKFDEHQQPRVLHPLLIRRFILEERLQNSFWRTPALLQHREESLWTKSFA